MYKPYSEYDVHLLFSEVRRVSEHPYMLHAAFLVSCLFEAYTPDEDEEDSNLEHTWGWRIPTNILESIVKNANKEFVYASENSLQIDIWGKAYSIRKANFYDKNRLKDIFNFKTENGDCIVDKSRIMNLAEHLRQNSYNDTIKELSDNKAYLRKIIMVAEDDKQDGWNRLTDIETTVYMWAIFYRKYQKDDAGLFRNKFRKNLCTTKEEDEQCWNDLAAMQRKPHGLYTFSADKIRKWNKANKQHSIIDTIDSEEANDYWYNIAIKTTCK